MDFERILKGFSVIFGIIFRSLYPMGFQVRSERGFERILGPKTLQNRAAQFSRNPLVSDLGAILGLRGPQDPPRALKRPPGGHLGAILVPTWAV